MPRNSKTPADIPPAPRAWDRQPAESLPAFEAFAAYLAMGPGRSITRLSAELGKAKSLLKGWSSRHGWVARCRAHFDHEYRKQDAVERAAERVRNAAFLAAAEADAEERADRMIRQQVAECSPEGAYMALVAAGKVPDFWTAKKICNLVRRATYRAKKDRDRSPFAKCLPSSQYPKPLTLKRSRRLQTALARLEKNDCQSFGQPK